MGNNIYNSLGDFYDAHQIETFDYAFGQFKAQLRECVRDEWVNEMARLQEENAKYADIKARWAEIEAERQREREEVERVKSSAVSQARWERLDKLFASVCPVVYTLSANSKPLPQCGKCDSNRLVHYKNPVTGKDMSERCPYCGHSVSVYSPKNLYAYYCKQFNDDNSLVAWYKDLNDDDGYTRTIDEFSDDKPFKDIRRYNAYFKSRERCQAYCDWLNKRERNREGDNA